MSEPTAEDAARRFRLCTKIEALARGTQTICDNVATAGDAKIVTALEKLKDEVEATLALALLIAEVAKHDAVNTLPDTERHAAVAAHIADDDLAARMAEDEGEDLMSDPIADVLAAHRVAVTPIETHRGPTTTLHTYALGVGTKVSAFANLAKDIAVAVGQEEVRIHAPVKGTTLVGVEVPNEVRTFPTFAFDRVHDMPLLGLAPLSFPVGVDQNNQPVISSLTKMPHLLIAGRTGSGKSVALTTVITGLIAQHSPDELEMTLIDPKRVELGMFADAPQVTHVVTDVADVADRLDEVVYEMDDRYACYEDAGVRNINDWNDDYLQGNRAAVGYQPYIVVVIDELADLMVQQKKTVEPLLVRIAQLGRAAGIHLVLATQRPTRDVITGLIKANVPSRWTFAVSSTTDSMVVLDQPGASALIGKGDSLWFPAGAPAPERVQAYLTPDAALQDVVRWAEQEWPEPQEWTFNGLTADDLDRSDDEYMSAQDAVAESIAATRAAFPDPQPITRAGLEGYSEELSEQLGMPVIVDPNLPGNVAVLSNMTAVHTDDIDPTTGEFATYVADFEAAQPYKHSEARQRIEAARHRKADVDTVYDAGTRIGEKLAGYAIFGLAAGLALFVLTTIFGG